MRLFLFSLTILLTCNGFAVASKPQTGVIIHREYDMPLAGKKIPYTMYVPKKYDGTKDLPVVFALHGCLLYTSPSPRDQRGSRMPSSA